MPAATGRGRGFIPFSKGSWCLDSCSIKGKSGASRQWSWTEYQQKAKAVLVDQLVKNMPAMQETPVQFLDQEDLLEKGMATHSNSLAWRIPCTEEPGGLQSIGLQTVRQD